MGPPAGAGPRATRRGSSRSRPGLQADFGIDVPGPEGVRPDAAQTLPPALATALRRRHIAIDVLVNNAGVLQQGEFTRMLPERHQELIDLNVSALTGMLAHFYSADAGARARPRTERRIGSPPSRRSRLLATYAATKAFRAVAHGVRSADELRDSGGDGDGTLPRPSPDHAPC